MNIVNLGVGLLKKIKKAFRLAYFLVVQKPLYWFSFNSNGNRFSCKGRLFNTSVILKGKNNVLIIKEGCQLCNATISIAGEGNRVIIEKNVVFAEGGRVRVEDENNLLHIGEDSNIINCFFSISDNNSKIEVGKDCLFSANIIIRNSDGHSIVNEEGKRLNYGSDVVIGDHVWIAYGVTILKGCHVADNSIIGTNAMLVNFQGEPNSIIVGSPAKCVKKGVNWDVNRLP